MLTISAHNDAKMGELVADALEKIGPEGAVTVEEAKTTETAIEIVQGMQFDRGYISPYFVTDPERMECVLEDPLIPTRQLAENSGLDAGVVVERMRSNGAAVGFDASHGTYVDLVQAGIVDPTKVVRIALENAVSVAGVLLLTEATLTEVPEEKSKGTHAAAQDFE